VIGRTVEEVSIKYVPISVVAASAGFQHLARTIDYVRVKIDTWSQMWSEISASESACRRMVRVTEPSSYYDMKF
jgi:hypothetical protein